MLRIRFLYFGAPLTGNAFVAALEPMGMDAVVPAAGAGTRLRPLTADQPKGLVAVADRPLLAHVFETLIDSGVDRLIVVCGYRGEQIRARFGTTYQETPIKYVWQDDRRGLGHAVYQAREAVAGPFVVLNGDNIVAGTLRRPIDRFRTHSTTAVVATETTTLDVARTTGVVQTTDDRVESIVEKPENPPGTRVTTGCYVLSPAIFDAIAATPLAATGEIELTHAIDRLAATDPVLAVPLGTDRVNVNTPADIDAAETLVA